MTLDLCWNHCILTRFTDDSTVSGVKMKEGVHDDSHDITMVCARTHATKAVGGDGHNAQTRTRGEVYAPRACAWNHSKGAINELNRGEFII